MSDWKAELDDFFENREEKPREDEQEMRDLEVEVEKFISSKVIPAFKEIGPELEKQGRTVTIDVMSTSGTIHVRYQGKDEFQYSVEVKGRHPYPVTRGLDPSDKKMYRAHDYFRSGSQDYTIDDVSKEEIIKHFLVEYRERVKYLDKFR